MQVNLDAFRMGLQMGAERRSEERQAAQDAQAAERFGWEREKQQRERNSWEETQRIASDMEGDLESSPAFASPYGGAPEQAPASARAREMDAGEAGAEQPIEYKGDAQAANPTQINVVGSAQANPATNNLTAGLKQGFEHLNSQRRLAVNAFKMAKSRGDSQAMMVAHKAVREIDMSGQRASIFSSVYSSPEAQSQVLQGMAEHPNPALRLRAEYGNDGVGRLVADDGQVRAQFTPEQLGMMAVHRWEMANGMIEQGYKGMAAINKEMADLVAQANGHAKELVSSSNDAAKTSATIASSRASAAAHQSNADYTNTVRTRIGQTQADVNAARASGAIGSGRAGKPALPEGASLEAQTLAYLERINKDAGSASKMTPEAQAQAASLVPDLARLNPRATREQIASLATTMGINPKALAKAPLSIDLDQGQVVYGKRNPTGDGALVMGVADPARLNSAQRDQLYTMVPQVAGKLGLPQDATGVRKLREASKDPAVAKQVLDSWMAQQTEIAQKLRQQLKERTGQVIPDAAFASELAQRRRLGENLIGVAGRILQK